MESKRIGIIGSSGQGKSVFAKDENKVFIVNSDRVLNPEDSRKYKNYLLTCKGRHQYRLIGKKWICQCGKELA